MGKDGGTICSSSVKLKPSMQVLSGPGIPDPPRDLSPSSERSAKNICCKSICRNPDYCNWQLLVDLERQLKFPSHVVTTTLRPDMVLPSESTKQVVLLELTVLLEDCLEEALKRKLPTRDWSAVARWLVGEQDVSQ